MPPVAELDEDDDEEMDNEGMEECESEIQGSAQQD